MVSSTGSESIDPKHHRRTAVEHFAGIDGLRERGLTGVEFVVADDHAGLKASIREVLPEAVYQRCYVQPGAIRPSNSNLNAESHCSPLRTSWRRHSVLSTRA
jgi:hypothetical protein